MTQGLNADEAQRMAHNMVAAMLDVDQRDVEVIVSFPPAPSGWLLASHLMRWGYCPWGRRDHS